MGEKDFGKVYDSNKLKQSLDQLNPIPDDGIDNGIKLLKSGQLYRYSCKSPEESDVSMLEKEFAEYVGSKYALAVNSCGSAIFLSLLSLVKPGDKVLVSAFTYTAVPSAIVHANAIPIFVECSANYCIDLDDLKKKASSDARVLILSHMRGHVADMKAVSEICNDENISIIEDCAHSLGAFWNHTHTGTFGMTGCFSFQSHKLLNAGEGGMLVTNDESIIAKAILYSGCQEEFWKRHFIKSELLQVYQNQIPNFSLRMSNLSAAIIRSQLKDIDILYETYRKNYSLLKEIISGSEYIFVPDEYPEVKRAPDTIQFTIHGKSDERMDAFIKKLNENGLSIKSFVSVGNPRYFKNWHYLKHIPSLPITENVLSKTFDMRLPANLNEKDIITIGNLIKKFSVSI